MIVSMIGAIGSDGGDGRGPGGSGRGDRRGGGGNGRSLSDNGR